MDTVRFDIALARHPPRRSPSCPPSPAPEVPSLSSDEGRDDRERDTGHAEALDVDLAGPNKGGMESPTHFAPSLIPENKDQSLGEKFHEWMETDLEHGL
jgi:hypothetical protein